MSAHGAFVQVHALCFDRRGQPFKAAVDSLAAARAPSSDTSTPGPGTQEPENRPPTPRFI